MLTTQEIQQTIYFLNKCSLTGQESTAHAILLQKFNRMLEEETKGMKAQLEKPKKE